MKIPSTGYTLDSFLEHIVDNLDRVFENQPRWLKVHLLFARNGWKEIFQLLPQNDYGKITHIIFHAENKEIDFYAYEWMPGLVIMITSSTEKDYDKTLKDFIANNKGISESWIKPSIFEEIRNMLVSKHNATIYRFISKRHRYWLTPAQIRPDYDRRISYSGEDAVDALKEYRALHGVIPMSIDMRVYGSKIQINRNGLFVIRHVNRKTIGLLQEIINAIAEKQARLQGTSEKLQSSTVTLTVGTRKIRFPVITAGKITLPNTKFSELTVKQMFKQESFYELGKSENESDEMEADFSFIDTFVGMEKSLVFSATVVDEIKGTIFGISGNESELALIPKHRTTFESFLSFYNFITENFDEAADLSTFSGEIVA